MSDGESKHQHIDNAELAEGSMRMRIVKIETMPMPDMQVPPGPHLIISSSASNRPIIQTFSCPIKRESLDDIDEKSVADLDAPAALRVCRICLAVDRKMFDMRDGKLQEAYTQVSGMTLTASDRLPRRLCWECAARVLCAARVRAAARRAHSLLDALSARHITLRDIHSIDRNKYQLKSQLSQKYFEPNISDAVVRETEVVVKLELEDPEQKGETVPIEYPVEDTRMNEEIRDDFADGGDDSDEETEDDDDTLLEVRKKLKRKGKVKKLKKATTSKEEGIESPAIPNMHIPRRIRHRKSTDWIDEFFTITTLTYKEQMANIQMRQESNNYHNAAYRCAVCYRGFHTKGSYEGHIMRHTEIYGTYECFICKIRQKNSHALQKHITALHKYKFSCKRCAYVTNTRNLACAHDKWHSGKAYKCPHCPSQFERPTSCTYHIRTKHGAASVCELCGFTCVTPKGIDQHKNFKHPLADTVKLQGPYCETCDVRFFSDEAHAKHLKLSSRHTNDQQPNQNQRKQQEPKQCGVEPEQSRTA